MYRLSEFWRNRIEKNIKNKIVVDAAKSSGENQRDRLL